QGRTGPSHPEGCRHHGGWLLRPEHEERCAGVSARPWPRRRRNCWACHLGRDPRRQDEARTEAEGQAVPSPEGPLLLHGRQAQRSPLGLLGEGPARDPRDPEEGRHWCRWWVRREDEGRRAEVAAEDRSDGRRSCRDFHLEADVRLTSCIAVLPAGANTHPVSRQSAVSRLTERTIDVGGWCVRPEPG